MSILFDGVNNPTTIEEVVGQAVGAASVCWESMEGTGVFDDARARQIVEDVLMFIKGYTYDLANKPNLGLATTGTLLEELSARARLGGYDTHRTVDN